MWTGVLLFIKIKLQGCRITVDFNLQYCHESVISDARPEGYWEPLDGYLLKYPYIYIYIFFLKKISLFFFSFSRQSVEVACFLLFPLVVIMIPWMSYTIPVDSLVLF
jgi:hypothetical protein